MVIIKPKPGLIPTFHDPNNVLRDFDKLTAQSGGIRRISTGRPILGRREISIEGYVLSPLYRKPGLPPPGQIKAPEYNKKFLAKQNMEDLEARIPGICNYHLAHSWGPGFGDEAAAGMMFANEDMNLVSQAKLESFLRDYAAEAERMGNILQLKATAISWDWQDNFADFLHYAEYKVRSIGEDKGYGAFTVTIEAPAPGVPGVGKYQVKKDSR